MKRYFLAPLADVQALAAGTAAFGHPGEYHYIDLSSLGTAGTGFVAVVLMNDRKSPPPGWQALPHLLDASTTVGSIAAPALQAGQVKPAPAPAAALADVGVTSSQTGYAIAKQLATFHPMFAP